MRAGRLASAGSAGGQATGGRRRGAAAGKAVFEEQRLRRCHTFEGRRDATGRSAPTSISCGRSRSAAGKPLEEFVHESIVDPDAYVEKGYPPNVMPKTYESLPRSSSTRWCSTDPASEGRG